MTPITATRQTHRVRPFPRRRALIPFDRNFTSEEFDRVKLGVIPREMEDHWCIFLEQGWLYFVRSWTGYCIFKVRVEQENNTTRIAEVWASRDPRQYESTDARYDATTLGEVIDYVLLKAENPS